MAHYRIRVQLIHWYELTVQADSAEEASSKVEALLTAADNGAR
jgi:hypothetical protein